MPDPESMGVEKVPNESDARSLLARGKKLFLLQEYDEALSFLGQACNAFARIYGEAAYECGEPYLIYGKALIEVARTEGGVIGDAIVGDDDDDDDDDVEGNDNVEANKVGEASNSVPDMESETKREEKAVSLEDESEVICDRKSPKISKITASGDDIQTNEGNIQIDTTRGHTKKSHCEGTAEIDSSALTGGEKSDEVANEDIGVDDMSTLHLAWEMIECARCIFLKNANDKESNLKVAETYLQLGTIGLESETYDQAVEDLKKCLKIQEEYSAPDRLIAVTYFTLGLAHCLNMDFDASKEAYSSCLNVLEKSYEALEKREGEEVNEGLEEKERLDLQSIISEVKEHINELNETKSESHALARKWLDKALFKEDTNECNGTSKETTDISHLVRKKEKINDGASTSKSSEEQALEELGSNNGNLKVATNISHLVRKKRKADEVTEPSAVDQKEGGDESIPIKVMKTE